MNVTHPTASVPTPSASAEPIRPAPAAAAAANRPATRHRTTRVGRWVAETVGFARASGSVGAFMRVMQVRLSQSRLGPVVCPRPIEVDVDLRSLGTAIRLRSHTTDISVLGELTSGGSYEAAAGLLPPDGTGLTIVDLGANTGLAARWLAARCPGARVMCVEPEPGNVAVLRHNLAGLDPAAEAFPVCVGGHERRVGLASTEGEFAFTMVDDDPSGDTEVWTMAHVLDRAGIDRIDLLKCDIEGAERELFADCAAWIHRVRSAVVECHDGLTAAGLVELLSSNGADMEVVAHEPMEGFPCELVTLTRR